MENDLSPALRDRIKRHEGFQPEPYIDTLGHITIGYGHKVESITTEYAESLLSSDLNRALMDAIDLFYPDIWPKLSELRRGVLIEMVYQLGKTGVSKFVKMKAALDIGDYQEAAAQMVDSQWYEQTEGRCARLAYIMRDDKEEEHG